MVQVVVRHVAVGRHGVFRDPGSLKPGPGQKRARHAKFVPDPSGGSGMHREHTYKDGSNPNNRIQDSLVIP